MYSVLRKCRLEKRSLDGGSRVFKRVNSKEELVDEDMGVHPQRLMPTLRELSSRDRVFSSGRIKDITVALANEDSRQKALKAMTAAHCAESLLCYLAVSDWEALAEDEAKEAAAHSILSRFVEDGPESLCLSESVRNKLLSHRTTAQELGECMQEIKKNALNDLRFNSILLRALGTQERLSSLS